MITKFQLISTALILLTISISSQSRFINHNSKYKYFVGTQEPDSSWRDVTFDDSSWTPDSGRIGYNEYFTYQAKKDSTTVNAIIPPTTSVYLRIPFMIDDKKAIHTLCLNNDYNDGFVAYLNGKEIARTNLGKPGEFIPYNRVTDRTHKAYDYRLYFKSTNGYYIDSSVVNNYLLNGTNVLAIQVHNDSINGSDMSFDCSLINITGQAYRLYQSYYLKQVPLDSSKLPIVVIQTDGYGIPNKDDAVKARMGIINKGNGKYNKPSEPYNDYNGFISMKIHGQSSADFPKKNYAIETRDSMGNNNNVSIMGMPKENDWILISQFADKSLIRNEFAFCLGRRQGHYEPRTQYCELILDGEFLGLYVMTEKIKRDSSRVHIAKLDSTEISGENITGGYIVKYDKPNNAYLQYVYPKEEDLKPEQKVYIDKYFRDYYSVLKGSKFPDPNEGYKKYIDQQSLIDYIIVEDAIKNPDAYYFSTFLYKDKTDKDGRIKYGPLWDNDLAMGNGQFQNGCQTNGWQFAEPTNNVLKITKIMQDTAFVHQFQKSWHRSRVTFLKTDSVIRMIDSLARYIKQERTRNYKVWPVLDGVLFYPCTNVKTYEEEIANIKEWMVYRLYWIDNNINSIYYPLTGVSSFASLTNNLSFEVYPNPFRSSLHITLQLIKSGNYTFELYDIYGRKIYSSPQVNFNEGKNEYEFDYHLISKLSTGMYVITITENGNIVYQLKTIKE
jgi:hypothetical protein